VLLKLNILVEAVELPRYPAQSSGDVCQRIRSADFGLEYVYDFLESCLQSGNSLFDSQRRRRRACHQGTCRGFRTGCAVGLVCRHLRASFLEAKFKVENGSMTTENVSLRNTELRDTELCPLGRKRLQKLPRSQKLICRKVERIAERLDYDHVVLRSVYQP